MATGFGATVGVGSTDIIITPYTYQPASSDWSVAFWCYRRVDAGAGTAPRVFDKNNGTESVLFYEDGTTGYYRYIDLWQSGSQVGGWSVTKPPAGEWHHCFVSYNWSSTVNMPLICIDGRPMTLNNISQPGGTKIVDAAAAITIGNRQNPSNRVWDGAIAHFAIWQKALTSGHAYSLGFERRSPLTIPAYLAYYNQLENSYFDSNNVGHTVVGTKFFPSLDIVQPEWYQSFPKLSGVPITGTILQKVFNTLYAQKHK